MKVKRPLTVAFVATLVVLITVSGIVTATTSTVVVTPTNPNGWVAQHSTCGVGTTGSQSYVDGPGTPPLGTGSHQFNIGADGDSFETLRTPNHNGTLIASITAFSYSTYIKQTGSGGQAPYLNLLVDTNGDGVTDDQLFFEPVYQDGNYGFPNQGIVTPGVWQDWDAIQGGWWALSAGGGPPLLSLASYASAHPGARISTSGTGPLAGALRIATGCGAPDWTGFIGNADALTFGANGNTTTYDFELHNAPTSASQCKNDGWKTFNPAAPHGPFKNQGDCIQYVNTGK